MDLPFVDEHRMVITAPRIVVWNALCRYAESALGIRAGHPLALVLGTRPPTGFEITHAAPSRELRAAGRHRFSTYALVFRLADTVDGQTTLTARTFAEFHGPHGRAYRALIMGSGAHVAATRRILRSIRRLGLDGDLADGL